MKTVSHAHADLQKLIGTAKEHSAKKLPTAYYQWRRAADRSIELMGRTHEWTFFCVSNLGKTLVEIGCHKEAISVLEAALLYANRVHGHSHFNVEVICQSLGRAYTAVGMHGESARRWEAAAISSECLRGKEHQTTIFCLSQQAHALARLGLNAEALSIFRDVMSRTLEAFGRNINTAFAARYTAECLNRLGCFEEALALWELSVSCFKHEEFLLPQHLKSLNWTYRELKRTKAQVKQLRAARAAESGIVEAPATESGA